MKEADVGVVSARLLNHRGAIINAYDVIALIEEKVSRASSGGAKINDFRDARKFFYVFWKVAVSEDTVGLIVRLTIFQGVQRVDVLT